VRALVVSFVLAGTVVAATVVANAAPSAASATRVARTTGLRTAGSLSAVAATSGHNAWAVGVTRSGRTLIVHWNGARWRRQSSPSPGHGGSLSGIAALSARSAWAVGTTGDNRALVLRWNGRAWTQVAAPQPGTASRLAGVAVLSAHNAWAVGSYFSAGGTRALIEHWNGTAWRRVPAPAGTLTAVTAVSAHNVWTVGNRFVAAAFVSKSLILHWNGSTWRRVASPGPVGNGAGLQGVSATTPHRVTAVGCSGCAIGGAASSLIERWNGQHWSASTAAPSGGDLFGVASQSARRAWAVGGYYLHFGDSFDVRTLIERWNGHTWTRVHSASPGAAASLRGVAVVSGRNAWAVGSYQSTAGSGSSEHTLILHWNGTSWH
jgi:hypothetical protein